MTLTDDIRAQIATLSSQISTTFGRIEEKLDEIDEHKCEEPGGPTNPVIPIAIDCLAGTIPAPLNQLTNPPHWAAMRAAFRTTMKNTPSGSIVFIGDSQIANMDVSMVTPFGVNLGIGGENSRALLSRLNDLDIDNQPNLIHRAGAVVIETFVNDMGDQATYGTAQNAIDTIVPHMLPRLKNWVTGKVVIICPTKVGQPPTPFWTSNTAIETLNGHIKAAFAGRSDVVVIDINPIIAPNGWLLPEYSTDYHHLNTPAAKTIKANAVKTALTTLGLQDSLTQ